MQVRLSLINDVKHKSIIHLDMDAFYPAVPEFTDDGFVIYSTTCSLLEKTAVGTKPVRLLGISLSQLSRLSSGVQLGLFEPDKLSDKRKKLNTALDSLREKFGKRSVLPGTLLTKQ